MENALEVLEEIRDVLCEIRDLFKGFEEAYLEDTPGPEDLQ